MPSTPAAVSDELFAPISAETELCYQTFGDPADEPLLLVMGLGGPMTWWPVGLCEAFAERGFYVIRYDNRDTGRSSRGVGRVRRGDLVRAFAGLGARPPYTLSDMAADGIALLDHLGIATADVCGVSMGGMIAQTLAIEHPDRVRSLTSIMSTTGRRTVGQQHPALLPGLLAKRATTREDYVVQSLATWRRIGSPAYPESREANAERARITWDRGISGSGVMRQMLAILTQPDRTAALGRLRMPTLVIHGLADKLVHVSGGRATARAVPGAELLLVAGMGHDTPQQLWPLFADGVRRTADRAAGEVSRAG